MRVIICKAKRIVLVGHRPQRKGDDDTRMANYGLVCVKLVLVCKELFQSGSHRSGSGAAAALHPGFGLAACNVGPISVYPLAGNRNDNPAASSNKVPALPKATQWVPNVS